MLVYDLQNHWNPWNPWRFLRHYAASRDCFEDASHVWEDPSRKSNNKAKVNLFSFPFRIFLGSYGMDRVGLVHELRRLHRTLTWLLNGWLWDPWLWVVSVFLNKRIYGWLSLRALFLKDFLSIALLSRLLKIMSYWLGHGVWVIVSIAKIILPRWCRNRSLVTDVWGDHSFWFIICTVSGLWVSDRFFIVTMRLLLGTVVLVVLAWLIVGRIARPNIGVILGVGVTVPLLRWTPVIGVIRRWHVHGK
jgi:hypothetical protein